MKLLNKKLNTDVCINFQYNSAISNDINDCYTFDKYEECKEFILEHSLSSGDAACLLSFAETYVESHDIDNHCTIYFSILGDKLVYSHYWMHIKERIQSFRDEKLLLRKDLLRIIECSDWLVSHNLGNKTLSIKFCMDTVLKYLIYVYKDYVFLCKRDGSHPHIYRCDNFQIIQCKNLEN